jgi:2-keto-4-pentenoate hydratase/2-oxohepta-3-ene-1,7-dioic acid hydratase in catechol pathway
MKLARVGAPGRERPVIVTDDGALMDLSSVTDDITPAFLGSDGINRAAAALDAGQLPPLSAREGEVRYGAPVTRPPKVLCIGLNYAMHAAESGMDAPTEPVLFSKMPYTVIGPHDQVDIPRRSKKTDYEVELAIVIGSDALYLDDEDAARSVIAGYAISNDVSEREFQLERGGQWVKGKACPTFNPLGPWLVTAAEVGDPQELGLELRVNGEVRQASRTSDMIFSCAHIVWYLSQFMQLEAGDVINTGTPAGVAFGKNDFPYLNPGDTMDLRIDGLGAQRQVVGQG